MESDKKHINEGVGLLKDILASQVNIEWFMTGGTYNGFPHMADVDLFYRSVGWMLEDFSRVHQKILRSCGVCEEGAGIFFACGPIHRFLLEGTVWGESHIAPALESLPGAVRSSRQINGRVLSGIFFPDKVELFSLRRRVIGD